MKINISHLELFSDTMAHCLHSGLDLEKCLRLSGEASPSRPLRRVTRLAMEKIREGKCLYESLETGSKYFPVFFIPVIRCGEEGGRLTETFDYLSDFCHKLTPVARVVRKTWLYPVVILSFGWSIRMILLFTFGKYQWAWSSIHATVFSLVPMILAVALLMKIDVLKYLIDWIKLQLPTVAETQQALGINTFFKSFSVAYKTSGMPVPEMVSLACNTIGNLVLRRDFLQAKEALDARSSFQDAFARITRLPKIYKDEIAVGEISGQLDNRLEQVTNLSLKELEFRLDLFNHLFQRLMSLTVIGSIAETAAVISLTL